MMRCVYAGFAHTSNFSCTGKALIDGQLLFIVLMTPEWCLWWFTGPKTYKNIQQEPTRTGQSVHHIQTERAAVPPPAHGGET